VINGGEPSIHPSFGDISAFLKQKYKRTVRLELGTNLVPLHRKTEHWQRIWREVLTTYDGLQIGCDDEHANIDQVEQLVPQALAAGLSVAINVIESYCRDETRRRILALSYCHGVRLAFSRLMHDYRNLPMLRDSPGLCRHRARDLMVACDGNVFFCFQQEHERPLFNLREASDEIGRHLLFEHEPGVYAFCRCCDRYEPAGVTA
jgi:hypothetical protein